MLAVTFQRVNMSARQKVPKLVLFDTTKTFDFFLSFLFLFSGGRGGRGGAAAV